MKFKLQEAESDARESVRERWRNLVPELTDEALDYISSTMVERIVHSRLMNDKEKLKRLHELMKGSK